MSPYEILLLSLALAADAFAVGICVGVNHHRPRQIFRLSFHFGLFQALMALAGMLGGRLLLELIQAWDHWVAFGLLAFIGGRMLLGDGSGETKAAKRDPTRGGSLVGLSVAVSLDALAAGVGVAATGVAMVPTVVSIGVVSSLATLLAFAVAHRAGSRLGARAEKAAGVVLIALGVKVLLEHTLS